MQPLWRDRDHFSHCPINLLWHHLYRDRQVTVRTAAPTLRESLAPNVHGLTFEIPHCHSPGTPSQTCRNPGQFYFPVYLMSSQPIVEWRRMYWNKRQEANIMRNSGEKQLGSSLSGRREVQCRICCVSCKSRAPNARGRFFKIRQNRSRDPHVVAHSSNARPCKAVAGVWSSRSFWAIKWVWG